MPMAHTLDTLSMTGAMPIDVWIPRISKLWSALSDAKCPPPSSDTYAEWTLPQLKKEIAQRKLKIDPKKRNKDAYAKLLLASDCEEFVSDRSVPPRVERIEVQPMVAQAVPQAMAAISKDPPQASPPCRQQRQVPHRPPRAIHVIANTLHAGGSQQKQMLQVMPAVSKSPPQMQQIRSTISVIPDEPRISGEVVEIRETHSSYLQKRKHVGSPVHTWDAELEPKDREYLGNQLRIKAAKLDIETRRFEMESKREKQNQTLQEVQLRLAEEQLKQAKIKTEKIKVEWMVDQALQRKRLRDAGISEREVSALV